MYTLIVESSLSPAYVSSLLSNSNVSPIDTGAIFEFNAQANSFIVALNTKMLEKEISQLGEFNVRVIQAMHVMLVGHRRTLQHMVEKINNILLSERITEDLRGIINRKKTGRTTLTPYVYFSTGRCFYFQLCARDRNRAEYNSGHNKVRRYYQQRFS